MSDEARCGVCGDPFDPQDADGVEARGVGAALCAPCGIRRRHAAKRLVHAAIAVPPGSVAIAIALFALLLRASSSWMGTAIALAGLVLVVGSVGGIVLTLCARSRGARGFPVWCAALATLLPVLFCLGAMGVASSLGGMDAPG